MRSGFTRDGILLAVASVAVAILLWLQVSLLSQPSKQKELEVVLGVRELPGELIITEAPDKVNIIAEAAPDQLDKIRAQDVTAYVDLAEAKEGRRSYRVQWTAPTKLNSLLTLKQSAVWISLARKKETSKKVEVMRLKTIAPGLVSDPANDVVDPESVGILGPEDIVDRVRKALVRLDMSQVRINGVYQAEVELQDDDGKPIKGLTIDPNTVKVRVAVSAAPTSRALLVVPEWVGAPLFGYRVKGYKIQPTQVMVEGVPEAVNAQTTIQTEPIDLQNLRANTTVTAKLKPLGDKGARLSSDKVKVTIEIEKVQVDPVTPPEIPPPGG